MKHLLLIAAGLGLTLSACSQTLPQQRATLSPTLPQPSGSPSIVMQGTIQKPLPTVTPAAVTYQGQSLPVPTPLAAFIEQPPPAWLVTAHSATSGTYGTFCYSFSTIAPPTCADWFGELPPALATARMLADAQPVVVIGRGAGPVSAVSAQIRPWSEQALRTPGRALQIDVQQQPDATVATLEATKDTTDQILEVSVTFTNYGQASYLWRINPASDT